MRHYLFIWIGIAGCFACVQVGHPLLAVISLALSWLVALFLKPVKRVESFSRHYMVPVPATVTVKPAKSL